MNARFRARLTAPALFAAVILAHGAPAAADGAGQPSALVTETPLRPGSLPQIITTYGQIEPEAVGVQTVTAPVQAQVTDMYVRPGALAPRGTQLLRLTPTAATALAYLQAQSTLALATGIFQHTQSLLAGHLATETQLMQARADMDNAGDALDTLRAQGAGAPRVITSPFSALVSAVAVAPGAIAAQGDPLVTLVDPNRLEVDAGLTPDAAVQVQPGDKVALQPIGGGLSLAGAVIFRADALAPGTGTVAVAIGIPAGAALLGETFRADITVATVSGYLVPHEAVLVGDTGAFHVMQDHGLTARQVTVQVLASDGTRDIVTGPLSPDAPVIVTGAYQLNDGDSIRLANPAGGDGP